MSKLHLFWHYNLLKFACLLSTKAFSKIPTIQVVLPVWFERNHFKFPRYRNLEWGRKVELWMCCRRRFLQDTVLLPAVSSSHSPGTALMSLGYGASHRDHLCHPKPQSTPGLSLREGSGHAVPEPDRTRTQPDPVPEPALPCPCWSGHRPVLPSRHSAASHRV